MSNGNYGVDVKIGADLTKFDADLKTAKKELAETDKDFRAIKKNLEAGVTKNGLSEGLKVAEKAIKETEYALGILIEKRKILLENKDTSPEFAQSLRDTEREIQKQETSLKKYTIVAEKYRETIKGAASDTVQKFGKSLETVGQKLKGVSIAAGGALAGIIALGTNAAKEGAEIDDFAQRLGVSAEKAQEWKYVAMQLGVDSEVFSKAMIKARAAMLDLDSGKTNEQAKAMQSLGLSMSNFETQEEMLDGVMNALSEMTDKNKQAALANEIFGDKIANELLPYLNAGKDALKDLKEEWAELGGMSNEQVSGLAKLDDMFFKVKTSIKNLSQAIGEAVIPLLEDGMTFLEEKIIPKFRTIVEKFDGLNEATKKMIPIILVMMAVASPLLTTIGKIAGVVSGIIKLLPILKTLLTGISKNPVIAIIGLVAILLGILYTSNENFRKSVNDLLEVLMQAVAPLMDISNLFLKPIIKLIKMMMQAIMPLIELGLIPLELILRLLEIPLSLIGKLLEMLMPLFKLFGTIVSGIFAGIAEVINGFLGFIENSINWVIDRLNDVIGLLNLLGDATGWYHIDSIQKVEISKVNVPTMDDTQKGSATDWDSIYRGQDSIVGGNTTISNNQHTDNSTKNITVNVTVEAHGGDVDVDDLINKVNIALAGEF